MRFTERVSPLGRRPRERPACECSECALRTRRQACGTGERYAGDSTAATPGALATWRVRLLAGERPVGKALRHSEGLTCLARGFHGILCGYC